MTHLRVVPPPGEVPTTPARRKGVPAACLSLTDAESRHLRAAIRNMARTFGGVAKLARALGTSAGALRGRKPRRMSPGVAVALWRLTGASLDALLRPQLAAVPSPAPTPGSGAA